MKIFAHKTYEELMKYDALYPTVCSYKYSWNNQSINQKKSSKKAILITVKVIFSAKAFRGSQMWGFAAFPLNYFNNTF